MRIRYAKILDKNHGIEFWDLSPKFYQKLKNVVRASGQYPQQSDNAQAIANASFFFQCDSPPQYVFLESWASKEGFAAGAFALSELVGFSLPFTCPLCTEQFNNSHAKHMHLKAEHF